MRRAFEWYAHTYEGRSTREFLAEGAVKRRKHVFRFLYLFVFACLVSYLVTQPDSKLASQGFPKAGEIAERNIYSPLTSEIETKETRAGKQDEAAKKVAPVFDYDDTAIESWLQRWETAFASIREEFYSGRPQPRNQHLLDNVSDRLEELTGQTVNSTDLLFFHQKKFSPQVQKAFLKMGEYLLGRLIAPIDLFSSYYSTGIIVRQVRGDLSETLVHDVSRIWSLEQAKEFLSQIPRLLNEKRTTDSQRLIVAIQHVVIPNLKFNATATQRRISTTLGQTRAPIQTVRKGEIIARKGERITEHHAELFQGIRELLSPRARLQQFLFVMIVCLVFFYVLFRFTPTQKGIWFLSLKDSLFVTGLALVQLLCLKFVTPPLADFFAPFELPLGAEFFLPISMGGLIIHLTTGKEVAFMYAILTSVIGGYYFERDLLFALWSFIVTVSAIQSIRSCKQRTDLYKCGAVSGAISTIITLSIMMLSLLAGNKLPWATIAVQCVLVFVSGLLSAVLAGGLIPVFESVLGYTTSLKLLEVANFNHPLLHTLMLKAPGTYHHSIIVGSLAEIAADRVHANALLARVSAYYHDIGKMTKPMYFIENQTPTHNPHDHLQPTMSAKILFSHVKNGVRLAKEYSLGKQITDIIEQHHGTTLVSYFFNKAKKSEDKEMDVISEADFRYPGPKPQTKEAAIVMLADACEASTRSISEPTPAKIQAMVHSIINKRILDTQFTECDLTFKDLQTIEECFTRTLTSLYHHRIEYPGQNRAMAVATAVTDAAIKKAP